MDDLAFVELLDHAILVLDRAFVDKLGEVRLQDIGALVFCQAAWFVDETFDACFDYFFALVFRSGVPIRGDGLSLVACCKSLTAFRNGVSGGVGPIG